MEYYYEEEHLRRYEPYPFVKWGERGDNKRAVGVLSIEEINFWDECDNVQIQVNVSLFNQRMLDEEYEAVEHGEHPLFFYEFTGEITSDVRKKYPIGKGRQCDLGELFGDWPRKDGERYFVFKIIDLDEEENAEEFQDDRPTFIGNLLFSASPILARKAGIVIEDVLIKDAEEAKKLNAIFSKWNRTISNQCIKDDVKIKEELDAFFGIHEVCTSIKVYDVGHANCCYCNLGYKKMFFDIGVTRSGEDVKTPLISSALTEISKLDADAVVLSHWDLDHILGVCYNQDCLRHKLWIVPNFENLYKTPPVAVKRVCNYLLKVGRSKVLMIDTSNVNKSYFDSTNHCVSLFLGNPQASHKINKANNGGLIMCLRNRRSILLPGDCENSIIPMAAVAKPYDYVLVPHHGSVMSGPRMVADPRGRRTAYICNGMITGKFNPDPLIADKYHKAGFKIVHATKNLKVNNKYVINL